MNLIVTGTVGRKAPDADREVTLQVLSAKGEWVSVSTGKPNALGLVRVTFKQLPSGDMVPAVRLVRGKELLDRVVSVEPGDNFVQITVEQAVGQAENRQLKEQLRVLERKHDQARSELAKTAAERDQVVAEHDVVKGDFEKLSAEHTKLQQRFKVVEAERDLVKVDFERVTGELVSAVAGAKQADEAADAATLALAISDQDRVELRAALGRTRLDLRQTKNQLVLSEATKGDLFTELFDLRDRVDGDFATHVPVDEVIGGLAAEIAKASDALDAESIGYELQGVQVQLNGLLDAAGTSVSLGARGVVPEAGSRLEFSFAAVRPVDLSGTEQEVPDLVGLTPIAVRRLLDAVGLRLESSTSSVEVDHPAAHSQAFAQSPIKGTTASIGDVIHVVFAQK